MSVLNLAVIGGDGIGPEVIAQGLRVLDKVASKHSITVQQTDYDYGQRSYARQGTVITDEQVQDLKQHDAIFFGAVGHPDVPPGIIEKGLLLKLRFELDQYINLRPVRLLPGIDSPLSGRTTKDIDFVVVRENTEDLYCGAGGLARKGTPQEIATQEMLATRFAVERCIRYAFQLASKRERKHLTLVHKTNVLTFCGDLWMRCFKDLAAEFPQVTTAYHHVDACCMYMVAQPEVYDVIVTPNMFGDIITDLGAAISGGMGLAASGNINPDGTSVSMYEPIHGSAPDIAGKNLANPLATADSLAMLLTETGRQKNDPKMLAAAEDVSLAVSTVSQRFTGISPDRSGHSTSEIGSWLTEAI